MGNPVVRWQIVTPDAENVAAFYKKLFGWSISANNALGYREVATEAPGGIDGGIWPAPPEAHTFVQLFVQVEDVDDAIRRAQEMGATVIVPRSPLPDGDTIAILRDPAGLPFGLLSTAPH
jgi:predicted enzyme related to lactoylglutathione lyase